MYPDATLCWEKKTPSFHNTHTSVRYKADKNYTANPKRSFPYFLLKKTLYVEEITDSSVGVWLIRCI